MDEGKSCSAIHIGHLNKTQMNTQKKRPPICISSLFTGINPVMM